MKTVELQIVHRLILKNLLDAKGNEGSTLSELNKMLKVIDKIALTEAEITRVGLRVEEGSLKWNIKGEGDVDLDPATAIDLADDQVDLVKAIIKEKSEKKELKLADAKPVQEIAEKLGMDVI
jgi:hypothetical protein